VEVQDLMGIVVEELQAGLTGGGADLPMPDRTIINWVLPGIPLHESFFDFAIAGPFAGPTMANLDDFEELARRIAGEGDGGEGAGEGDGGAGGEPMSREQVLEEAKRMYQQQLLGSWEQWSRLVDFIPMVNPSLDDMTWAPQDDQGSQRHIGIVYAQAGQRLSQVYKDTLERCMVADEPLTEEQQQLLERMRKLLQVEKQEEDFLTGEVTSRFVDSPAMTLYKQKKSEYENRVLEFAAGLRRANSGTAGDAVEWSQSGGILRNRALDALQDWQAMGNKRAIEEAQAAIAHITGGSMVSWKQNLLDNVNNIEESTIGAFGYPFFPSTILPGAFARSSGWTRYSQRNLTRRVQSSTTSHSGGGTAGLNLGFFSIGGSGGGSRREHNVQINRDDFGLEFEYTQVEISRPAFNPNFFLSRGWKPRDSFIRDYQPLHSDGEDVPTGALVGYPTKALFIRNLRIYSSSLASAMESVQSTAHGGGFVGIGPFVAGGRYAHSSRRHESNFSLDTAGITVHGLQLVAFVSALFPYSANPNPDVQNWI